MSGFRGIWTDLLGDAIAAGRATLRRLDPPEVPASLRRVAAYSGGQLPPPLAASLLAEIDRNGWLREKVVADWAGDTASPSGLFLERPDGWWVEVAAAAEKARAQEDDGEAARLRKQLAKTEAKLKTATAKAADHKRALRDARQGARNSADAVRRALEEKHAEASIELAEARAGAAELGRSLAALEQEHHDLQESYDAVRSRLARARRLRMDAPSSGGSSGSVPADPVKLARLLDLQAASFGRNPHEESPMAESSAEPLVIEPGVRPDSSDAIRWLLGLDRPVVVLVDGYNAQFHIDRADFTSGRSRRELVEALQRLRAASKVRHRVVVVYDSTLPGERMARTSLGGVEVRFAEKELIADEEIVAMAADLDEVVVLSSDREVREGAEDGGAVVLWSEALRDWLDRS